MLSPEAKEALSIAKHNAGVNSWEDLKRNHILNDFQHELAIVWEDVTSDKTRVELRPYLIQAKMRPLGTVGEIIPFNGIFQQCQDEVWPGDKVIVKREGWQADGEKQLSGYIGAMTLSQMVVAKVDAPIENILNFEQKLGLILEAASEYKCAVSIVQDRSKWLLGLARNTKDDRTSKWVFPGGHIKPEESPKKAAVRECYEETGIRCRAVGEPFTLPGKPEVAFVHCKVSTTGQKIKPNHEFASVGTFTKQEMRSFKLRLYKNVLDLIEKVT